MQLAKTYAKNIHVQLADNLLHCWEAYKDPARPDFRLHSSIEPNTS